MFVSVPSILIHVLAVFRTHSFGTTCAQTHRQLTLASARPIVRPSVVLDNRPLSKPAGPLGYLRTGEWENRKGEGGRAPTVALGIVYVTHRQEPERQTVAEDVTEPLSAVSGFCQLSVAVSLSLTLSLY